MRYVMIVDKDNCNQCYACALACKDEHFGNDFTGYTESIEESGEDWVGMHIKERGEKSKTRVECWPLFCLHCADPACAAGNADAVSKRADGIVLFDPDKVKGDKSLAGSCPYNAVSWNEEKATPQKCTLCAHLLDAGEIIPRCVEACPNGTLVFGDLDKPDDELSSLLKAHPELTEQTGVVRYFGGKGRFFAGTIYEDKKNVAIGYEVTLTTASGEPLAKAVTTGFGDFLFEGIGEMSSYTLEINTPSGFVSVPVSGDPDKDISLEEIYL